MLDLGRLSLISNEGKKESLLDEFTLKLTEISAVYASDHHQLKEAKDKMWLLLQSFDIQLQMMLCRLDTEEYPTFALSGTLPNLHLQVTPKRLQRIVRFIVLIIDQIPITPSQVNLDYLLQGLELPAPQLNKQTLLKKKFANINLTVPKVSLSLVHDDSPKNIIVINLIETNFQLTKRSYDASIDLSLKGFEVEDHLDRNSPKLISSSNSGSKLLQLSLKNIERESPEYDLLDTLINLKVDSLYVMFNRQTVVRLIEIILEMVSQLPKPPPKPAPVSLPNPSNSNIFFF